MPAFDPRQYGAAVEPLLSAAPPSELGPGTPNRKLRAALAALTPESVVGTHKLIDRDMAAACCAGLWLRHDFLDESHQISQSLDTREGSYWHAIMHRREPDFGNAKYWFRRVGAHPIFAPLCAAAQELAAQSSPELAAKFLADQRQWDPMRFVDLCEKVLNDAGTTHDLCRRIQLCEWELLFDYCLRQAVGEGRE